MGISRYSQNWISYLSIYNLVLGEKQILNMLLDYKYKLVQLVYSSSK